MSTSAPTPSEEPTPPVEHTPPEEPTRPVEPTPEATLADAEDTEAALRAQLGELISARVRAEAEAARLADRATLAGADPSLSDLSARYRDQAGRLAGEVEGVRAQLRAHEARTEALRADARGA